MLFFLAGTIPVLVAAILAYQEITNGQLAAAQRLLQQHSRDFGTEILSRLAAAAEKAEEFVRIAESDGIDRAKSNRYLYDEFSAAVPLTKHTNDQTLSANRQIQLQGTAINVPHLDGGNAQLLSGFGPEGRDLAFVIRDQAAAGTGQLYLLMLNREAIWNFGDELPFQTDFCVLTNEGKELFCDASLEQQTFVALIEQRKMRQSEMLTWDLNGTKHFLVMRQLFLPGLFAHPSVEVIVSQPAEFAMAPIADFEKIFPPVLILAIILVGLLSSNLVGKSLTPLRRLTLAARDFANGNLKLRVELNTQGEFESLGDSFNEMASGIEHRISTLTAMAKIDRLILAGSDLGEISECALDCLVKRDALEIAAVVAQDVESQFQAKVIFCASGVFHHERVSLHCGLNQISEIGVHCLFEDLCDDTRDTMSFLSAYNLQRVVISPISTDDDLQGILILGSKDDAEYSDERVQLCHSLAGRVGVALTNTKREEALYRQAHYDALTGLPNRQLLKDRLDQYLGQARRDHQDGAILFLDLDRFKETNDVYGHTVGDSILRLAAERIVSEVREGDTVARLGGDEFVVVMPMIESHSGVVDVAGRLVSCLSDAFTFENTSHYLGASIGVVVFPEDGDSVETLLRNADDAMYRAKDAGRSCFEFFSQKLNSESRRKIELERDLRAALAAQELELYYQPQFEINSGAVCGAEALVRWRHQQLGSISPDEFIQIAEDTGIIVELGNWVLEQACADMRSLILRGLHPGELSVNVSARQLGDPNFATTVFDILRRFDIRPEYLVLEITETAVAQNRDTVVVLLNELRSAGIRIAIDDFGTGYSSLSYLQHLPFDILKIDKSFIELLLTDKHSEKICRTIIMMATELEKQTVGEGVETASQAEFLSSNGCGKVQGHLYSRPLPRPDFIKFIENQDAHTQRRRTLEKAS